MRRYLADAKPDFPESVILDLTGPTGSILGGVQRWPYLSAAASRHFHNFSLETGRRPYVDHLHYDGMESLNLTPKMARVIKVFLEDPAVPRYGFELMRLTAQPSGTLYPILARLEAAGWLVGGKEDINPHVERRPRRRTYTIAGEAVTAARVQLAALSDELRPPSVRSNALKPQGGLM